MCGLFGWQFEQSTLPSKRQRRKLAKALTWHMDKRGGQAWGVWSDGRLYKGINDANPHCKMWSRAATVMGHTRYATHGDKNNLDHAHPFKSGSIYLAHNGVLSNHAELNKKYDRKCEVDSQHLLLHLIEAKPFGEIEGYGVITFLDETAPGSVKLARLREKGDLSVAKTKFGCIWASTKDAVEEACEYANIDIETFYTVEPGVMHMAEEGALFVAKEGPDLKVKEPEYHWDWRSGYGGSRSAYARNKSAWWDDADDDAMGHWDRLAARPTPPVTPIAPVRLGSEVWDEHYHTDPTAPFELGDYNWEMELEKEKAQLWLEDTMGITSAAFDGMSAEEVIDTALDMGWAGYMVDEPVAEAS